jgi:5-hydroxyisourate hydrolase-like protein (transthyretin family)
MAVFLCVFAAGAKTPKSALNVQVNTVEGKPIEHADVEVKAMRGEKLRTIWKLRTHEDGLVRTPAETQIPQGSILIEATAPGFAPFSQKFEVHESQQTIEIQMTSAMTKLSVHVTTLSGKPIDHADVVVKFVSGRSIVELGKKIMTSWEVRSNQEGMAKVPEIPQGTILIQVIAKGYQTFGQTFEVNQIEKTIEVTMNSPQEQYSAH